jgi:energy-coupling factor transporter ATP-binding protein EcfA2
MLVRPASLLLLDEPTNHLDLRARDILEEALDQYTGTIVFISHDRYFINRIATAVCMIGAGGLEVWPGSYDDFMEHLRERQEAPSETRTSPPPPASPARGAPERKAGAVRSGPRVAASGTSRDASAPGKEGGPRSETRAAKGAHAGVGHRKGGSGSAAPAPEPAPDRPQGGFRWVDEDPAVEPPGGIRRKSREQKRDEARERDRLHRETRGFKERLAAVEKEIAALEVRLKEVQIALSDPGLYKDGEKTRDVSRAHKEIQERIAWLYDEWAHLEEAIARLGSPGQGG